MVSEPGLTAQTRPLKSRGGGGGIGGWGGDWVDGLILEALTLHVFQTRLMFSIAEIASQVVLQALLQTLHVCLWHNYENSGSHILVFSVYRVLWNNYALLILCFCSRFAPTVATDEFRVVERIKRKCMLYLSELFDHCCVIIVTFCISTSGQGCNFFFWKDVCGCIV